MPTELPDSTTSKHRRLHREPHTGQPAAARTVRAQLESSRLDAAKQKAISWQAHRSFYALFWGRFIRILLFILWSPFLGNSHISMQTFTIYRLLVWLASGLSRREPRLSKRLFTREDPSVNWKMLKLSGKKVKTT